MFYRAHFHLTPEDFKKMVLVKFEGTSLELAEYIAKQLSRKLGFLDVRDGIHIAELAKTKE